MFSHFVKYNLYVQIFSSDEDVAVVKCSLYLLKTALDSIKMLDIDSFMLMIKFVLCAISKTVSRSDIQEINQIVMNYLEEYLQQMNNGVYYSNAFDIHNKHKLKIQVKVQKLYVI